jgi:serine protease Do
MRRYSLLIGIILLNLFCVDGALARENIDVQAIYGGAKDAVVLLISYDKNNQPLSLGSGFFVENDILVTNLHVIAGAASIKIKFMSGELLPAAFALGIDVEHDVALLQAPLTKKPLRLQLDPPGIGEPIIAIGNPLGLQGTVSTGIVSGIRKDKADTYYQITAPISPGSSGGPIIDENGLVIGISTFTLAGTQSLNFAIPSSYVNALLRSPKKTPLVATITLPKASTRRAADERVTVRNAYIEGGSGLASGLEASVVNGSDKDIRNVRIIAVFYAANDPTHPVDYLNILVRDTIPAHLAKRFSESYENLNLHGDDILSVQIGRGRWVAKFRVLDYEIVRDALDDAVPR